MIFLLWARTIGLIAMLMQFWVRFMPLAFENYGWGL